jgi:hypothetical protein
MEDLDETIISATFGTLFARYGLGSGALYLDAGSSSMCLGAPSPSERWQGKCSQTGLKNYRTLVGPRRLSLPKRAGGWATKERNLGRRKKYIIFLLTTKHIGDNLLGACAIGCASALRRIV